MLLLFFHQTTEKVCKCDQSEKSRKQLEVKCVKVTRWVRVNKHRRSEKLPKRWKGIKDGPLSLLRHEILLQPRPSSSFGGVSLPVHQVSKHLSEREKRCACASLPFTAASYTEKSLDRPAAASVHSGKDDYCLQPSTPVGRRTAGTELCGETHVTLQHSDSQKNKGLNEKPGW